MRVRWRAHRSARKRFDSKNGGHGAKSAFAHRLCCFEMEAGRNRQYGHPGAKRSGVASSWPGIWEEIAMKAALLFVAGVAVAMVSIVPANAQSKPVATALATTTGNCSTTTDFTISPVPCTAKRGFRNYVECTEWLAKHGGRSTDGWWWCTNQGFKN
jgi:hypothetical protein